MGRKLHYSLLLMFFSFCKSASVVCFFGKILSIFHESLSSVFVNLKVIINEISYFWWSIGWEIKAFTKLYHKIIYWYSLKYFFSSFNLNWNKLYDLMTYVMFFVFIFIFFLVFFGISQKKFILMYITGLFETESHKGNEERGLGNESWGILIAILR